MDEEKLEILIRKVYNFLENCGFEYLIIGGLATGAIGEPRITADIDVIIFVKFDELKDFMYKANLFGFQFDPVKLDKDAKEKYCFQMNLGALQMDCLIATTAFEAEALMRKIRIPIGDLQISFPSPEDLILMKLLVGREKDWLDAKNVALRHRNKLDLNYLENWAKTFSEMRKDNLITNKLKQLLKEAQ